MTTTTTTTMTSASGVLHKPWQFDWKRPVLLQCKSDGKDKETSSSSFVKNYKELPPNGITVAHSAAMVAHEEVIDFVTTTPSTSTTNSNPNSNNNNESTSFLLTVTLIQSSGKSNNNKDDDTAVADIVLLELMEQKQQHPQQASKRRTSSTLRRSHGSTSSHNTTTSSSHDRIIMEDTSSVKSNTSHNSSTVEERTTNTTTPTDSSSSYCRCLQSRLLRWPAATLDYDYYYDEGKESDEDRDITTTNNMNEWWKGLFRNCMPPSQRQPQQRSTAVMISGVNNNQSQTTPTSRVGLVAATLVRVPKNHPTSSTNEATQAEGAADARDVVQLMALLGHHPTKEQQQSQTQPQQSTNNNLEHDNEQLQQQSQANTTKQDVDNNNSTTAIPELKLACLSSDGNVHIYSPWALLLVPAAAAAAAAASNLNITTTTTTKQQKQQELTTSMATLIFGSHLLASADDTLLPLSQPLYTIPLSVPYLLKQRDKKHLSKHLNNTSSNRSRNSSGRKSQPPQQKEQSSSFYHHPNSMFSMWDASVWDSTVDTATRAFQTQHNVPTHCIAALEYIAIAGRGRQRWNQQRNMMMMPQRERRQEQQQQQREESLQNSITTTNNNNKRTPLVDTKQKRQSGTKQTPSEANKKNATVSWLNDNHVQEEEEEANEIDDASEKSDEQIPFSNWNNDLNDGGFITFISLRTFSEVRTLYVPFVPQQLSPFTWCGLSFVLVIGYNRDHHYRAVAIRIDSSLSSSLMLPSSKNSSNSNDKKSNNKMDESSSSVFTRNNSKVLHEAEFVHVDRFQILPIDLPLTDASTTKLVGSEMSTFPPSIAFLFQDTNGGQVSVVQRTLCSIGLMPRIELSDSSFSRYGHEDYIATIRTNHANGHSARNLILAPPESKQPPLPPSLNGFSNTLDSSWCHLGQGWCLVGSSTHMYFICFEGATSERDAYVYEFVVDDKFNDKSVQGLVGDIIPLNPFSLLQRRSSKAKANVPSFYDHQTNKSSASRLEAERLESGLSEESSGPVVDEIVVEAMESISNFNYRETVASQSSLFSPRRKSTAFSHREKSQRLLRHCSSWNRLDNPDYPKFSAQIPSVSVRLGSRDASNFILSLREAAIENGYATPYQNVLSWLSDQEDYFTAASLALDLLRDTESLRYLWKAFDKIDDEDERSKLEGLLDGIIPISVQDEDDETLKTTLTQLADMTVGCLTKGGYAMASTLEHFLSRDSHYDPSRASLMLVATTASTMSDDEDLVSSAMGKDYLKDDTHIEKIMWPVRCLLKIGVSRDYLVTALLLLNSTIPDELRRRQRSSTAGASVPSLEMCKNLVSLIVASSPDAAETLLDLVDEKSHCRFWESLNHGTRLELALISIEGRYPLIREPEIRSWALVELQKCMEFETSASSSKAVDNVPSDWLKTIVFASLQNAGCEVNPLFESETTSEQKHDGDALERYAEQEEKTRNALMPAHGTGGLDFDLIIPALLILEHRNTLWHRSSKVSTRSILNACCYLAGRRNIEEPLFVMDGATLMRQCTLVGDVEAGAKLIGGKNGLVLECCHVLMETLDMDIEAAERFLLSEPMECDNLGPVVSDSRPFTLLSSHRRLLMLLDEHVLSIRTYGEFETKHLRGKIDPVFAGTICFRTWWSITRPQLQDSTKWLIGWLREKLSIHDYQTTSPNRLACAALSRALIWPDTPDGSNDAVLASRLEIDGRFLVQLCQPCCGLVESLPTYIVDKNQQKETATARLEGLMISPIHDVASGGVDETFYTAISTPRALDSSAWED